MRELRRNGDGVCFDEVIGGGIFLFMGFCNLKKNTYILAMCVDMLVYKGIWGIWEFEK